MRDGRAAARRRFRYLPAHYQRFGDCESSVRADLLHDERAVQAQKRCLRSFDDALLDFTTLERVKRAEVRNAGPIEDRHNHRRRKLEGRLLDRQHLPGVLAARAIVMVLLRSLPRRGPVLVITLWCMAVAVAVRRVAMPRVGVRMNRNCLAAPGRRRLAGHAPAEQGAEVAAAEWHGSRQEDGHKEPEWTAAMEHTSPEYIGGHGTALRTGRFEFHRAVGSRSSVQGAFRQNGWLPFVIEGILSRFNRRHWPTSPRSPVRIGSPRLWIRGQSAK